MSSKALSMVIHHSKASPTARHVLTIIAWFDGESGSWPSQETIHEKTGMSKRTIGRAIKELLEIGEIDVIANDGGSHHGRRSNRYVILLDCDAFCDGTFAHRYRGQKRTYSSQNVHLMRTKLHSNEVTVSSNISRII
jgi:biotin operon repressor